MLTRLNLFLKVEILIQILYSICIITDYFCTHPGFFPGVLAFTQNEIIFGRKTILHRIINL